jgi:hypothetical protein
MYAPAEVCSQQQNQHCGLAHDWNEPIEDPDTANCTIMAPRQLNEGKLMFQDRMYITTK